MKMKSKQQFLDADQNDNRSIILSSPKGGQSCAEKGSLASSRASIQFELKSIPEFEDVKIEDEDYMTFERFKKAANMGDVEGKYNVGCCYEKGIGVEKDEFEAFRYYLEAASMEHSIGAYNVGIFCENGTGVEKDESKAFIYFQISADMGNANGAFSTGACIKYNDVL